MASIPRLHLISSRDICSLDRFPELAVSAVAVGVDAIHLRESDLDRDQKLNIACTLKRALAGSGASLIINRDAEVAAAIDAEGVQLPEAEMNLVPEIRSSLDPGKLVGVSVHSVASAVAAEAAGADYVIAGHVFDTSSKPGVAGRGLQFIDEVSGAVEIPVIAIGGISPVNAGHVVRAGAWGVAVMSTILSADDPESVARSFLQAVTVKQGEE
jgi:thiamine-phosphate diphosphorylase